MKALPISGLMALLAVAPLQAEPLPAEPAPAPIPSVVSATPALSTQTASAASTVSDAAAKTSQEVAEVKEMFNQVYANANKNMSPGASEILAIGTGAGLGFLASGFIMNAWIAPVAASLATTLGLSEAATGIVTGSVTTIGIISGTYAGGVYARNLVSN